ncbi:MAG: ABC transporter ATP-binding protein [Lachnospiraceae bacterium]|nr:ABC transporter ATP-binding protein [Lachnospiraceae bacterium]
MKSNKQSSISKLFAYAGGYKYFTIASWILAAVSALGALVPFFYIWKIVKEVLRVAPDFEKAEKLEVYGWMAVGFALGSMAVYIAALLCSHVAAFRVQYNMRARLMNHIVKLPMGELDKEGTGKIRRVVNESTAATETYLAHQLPDQAVAVATPVGLLVLLFYFDCRLGLLSFIPIILAFSVMMMMTGKEMARKMKEYENALGELSNEAVEYVRGISVIKTFGQTVFSFEKFKKSIEKYQKWTIAYTKDLRMPMILYTTLINAMFAILVTAALVMGRGGVTDELILNIFFYIIVTPVITVMLNKIMFASKNAMIVDDSLARIEEILARKPLAVKKSGEKPQNYSITLQDVSFRYADAVTDAIHKVSLNIAQGEHVAFVGPSGGGKTTLASLIARYFDVCGGEILIGGINVKNIEEAELMDIVSFVFQDSKLLKMSILDNVRMARPEASKEEVLKALKDAQCMDIIEKFPKGIDTIIGAKGVFVSGGEAQRLSIARAMLKNAPIVILDEATAFADPDNEVKVQEAFAKLSEGKTVIMIAHRLSTVTEADCIYVLKDGEVAEYGTHEKLIGAEGIYQKMWNEYNKSVDWKVGA